MISYNTNNLSKYLKLKFIMNTNHLSKIGTKINSTVIMNKYHSKFNGNSNIHSIISKMIISNHSLLNIISSNNKYKTTILRKGNNNHRNK